MRPKNVPISIAPNVLSSAGTDAPSAEEDEDAPVEVGLADIVRVPAVATSEGGLCRKQVGSEAVPGQSTGGGNL